MRRTTIVVSSALACCLLALLAAGRHTRPTGSEEGSLANSPIHQAIHGAESPASALATSASKPPDTRSTAERPTALPVENARAMIIKMREVGGTLHAERERRLAAREFLGVDGSHELVRRTLLSPQTATHSFGKDAPEARFYFTKVIGEAVRTDPDYALSVTSSVVRDLWTGDRALDRGARADAHDLLVETFTALGPRYVEDHWSELQARFLTRDERNDVEEARHEAIVGMFHALAANAGAKRATSLAESFFRGEGIPQA